MVDTKRGFVGNEFLYAPYEEIASSNLAAPTFGATIITYLFCILVASNGCVGDGRGVGLCGLGFAPPVR